MKRLLLLSVAAVLVAAGCTSDLRRVADANALQVYQETRYERECVEVVGPPSCSAWQKANDALFDEVALCDEVQKIGHLPAIAKKRLDAAKKKVEAQP